MRPSIYQTRLEAGKPVLPLNPRLPPPGPSLKKEKICQTKQEAFK